MDVSSGGGIIKTDQTTAPSYPYTYDIDSDTPVSVEAVPAFGYVFDGWSGDLSGTTNPATIVMDCDKSVTANFSIDWALGGMAIGSLVIVGFLISVLIIKRRAG